MSIPTRFAALGAAMFLMALAGCSTQAPKVTVLSASLAERTPEGIVVNFEVQADNLNPDPLPLQDVSFDVFLSDRLVFSGTRSAEATARRYGTQSFILPAAIPVQNLATEGSAVPYAVRGRLTYIVPGALAESMFDIHALRPSTDFSGQGVVDLSAAPTPQVTPELRRNGPAPAAPKN